MPTSALKSTFPVISTRATRSNTIPSRLIPAWDLLILFRGRYQTPSPLFCTSAARRISLLKQAHPGDACHNSA